MRLRAAYCVGHKPSQQGGDSIWRFAICICLRNRQPAQAVEGVPRRRCGEGAAGGGARRQEGPQGQSLGFSRLPWWQRLQGAQQQQHTAAAMTVCPLTASMQSCLMAWEAHETCFHHAVTLSIGAQPHSIYAVAGGAARGTLGAPRFLPGGGQRPVARLRGGRWRPHGGLAASLNASLSAPCSIPHDVVFFSTCGLTNTSVVSSLASGSIFASVLLRFVAAGAAGPDGEARRRGGAAAGGAVRPEVHGAGRRQAAHHHGRLCWLSRDHAANAGRRSVTLRHESRPVGAVWRLCSTPKPSAVVCRLQVASTRHTAMPEGEQADRVRELLWRQAALSAHGGRVDKLPPGSRPPGQAVHQRGGGTGGGRGGGGRMSSGEGVRDCTASAVGSLQADCCCSK